MKRKLLFFLSTLFVGTLLGQPVLSYENHRLLPGVDNPMTLCEYMQPGQGGAEVIWDFSDIKAKNEFVGRIVTSYNENEFEDANTRLVEFKTSFFFDINESGIYQVGYASEDGKTQVKYQQPFEKLRFPFTYENNYTTDFAGEYLFNSKKIGDVTGGGAIEADAWGDLILPNNKLYENTLRVKTIKNYTITYSNNNISSVEILTYRWYNSMHRYPLLVLTEYKTTSGTSERINYQAAYNNNAVSAPSNIIEVGFDQLVNVYPNPAEDELYIDITSNRQTIAYISIIDVTGKVVVNEKVQPLIVGKNVVNLTDELQTLKAGAYILQIRKDNEIINKEIAVSNK